jgi:hypothetical protein
MKRRMTMLAAVTIVSGLVTVFSPTSPAQSAIHSTCTGTGNAHLDNTFFYPVNSTTTAPPLSPRSANFTFHLNGTAAACVTGTTTTLGGPSATGQVHGWCGLSVGSGAVTGGGSFSWVGIGSWLSLSGQVSGLVNATPNLFTGDSCVSGADDFIVTGEAEIKSCSILTSQPVTISAIPPVLNAHMSGHVHVCVPVP